MHKLCKQVSIESPGPTMRECVFSFEIPVPEVPPYGARIRVVYAGACYRVNRTRSASICSTSSLSSVSSIANEFDSFGISHHSTPAHAGLRDGALFPGYEVAGVVDVIGSAAEDTDGIREGTRIVLYPYEGVPHGYAEYIVVPDFKCLVPIPDKLPLSVAAMLPTGALLAMNTVDSANEIIKKVLNDPKREDAKILIVGTGGLALWALRIASHQFKNVEYKDKVRITVASIRDEGFVLAKESEGINVVQWTEDLYEKQLIERTIDTCKGPVDVVMNFGTTSRSLHRAMQCLAEGGVALVTEDVGEKLLPRFSQKAKEMKVHMKIVPNGSIEQLRHLVKLVADGEICPPPHTVFPAEDVQEVVRKLCNSEINGRAILKFQNID